MNDVKVKDRVQIKETAHIWQGARGSITAVLASGQVSIQIDEEPNSLLYDRGEFDLLCPKENIEYGPISPEVDKIIGETIRKLVDSVENLMSLVDTPIGRSKFTGSIADEIRAEADELLVTHYRRQAVKDR